MYGVNQGVSRPPGANAGVSMRSMTMPAVAMPITLTENEIRSAAPTMDVISLRGTARRLSVNNGRIAHRVVT